ARARRPPARPRHAAPSGGRTLRRSLLQAALAVTPRRPREPRPALAGRGARVAAFDLLARKAGTGRDLRARLVRRGASADLAREVVAELEGKGYVDDQAFARWWGEAGARGRRVGSVRLTQELRAKGIAPALVSAAVESAFAEVPEAERAVEAARRGRPAVLRVPAWGARGRAPACPLPRRSRA